MKNSTTTLLAAIATGLASWIPAQAQQALGTDFTYQGRLDESGAPLNDTADFEFRLFDDPSGGAQVGSTSPVSNVDVVDGLFTVSLDFGSSPFNGDQRWLQIAVRSPAGSGNFSTLSPRQPLTATPFALYALSGPGSGGPWAVSGNDVFNTNTGNVGIGTTSPENTLHVNGDFQWGGTTTNYAWSGEDGLGLFLEQKGSSSATSAIRIQTSRSGDFSNYSQFFIDPNAGFSFRSLGTANGNVGIGTTSPTNRLSVVGGGADVSGNVGIGTTSPAAKLDVRGNIRLGNSGELFAPGGSENLRIIRGSVRGNGTIQAGSGFGVTHDGDGIYTITFTPAFSGPATVVASTPDTYAAPIRLAGVCPICPNLHAQSFIRTYTLSQVDTDTDFTFIAVGPR